jgi:hypothetical protein
MVSPQRQEQVVEASCRRDGSLEGSAIRAFRATFAVTLLVLLGTFSSPCSALTGEIELFTSVEPLSGKAFIDGDRLVVDELNPVGKWKITYHIVSMAEARQVSRIFALDSYGPELSVESANATSGNVLIGVSGKKGYGQSVEWSGLTLGRGSCASLTVILETSGSPAARQRVTSGDYVLNAGMVVESTARNGTAIHRSTGEKYTVKIRRVPQMRLAMSSPQIIWYIRRPGDYYVKAFYGTVTSNALVVVAFSDFTDLRNDSTGERLPVSYCFQTPRPEKHEWIPVEELSTAFLEVPSSEEATEWTLWQRIVVGNQGVGEYTGRGVITFTMQNVQDTFY